MALALLDKWHSCEWGGLVATEKQAPAKMHYFISELLLDLALRGKVLSIQVEDSTYLVTLSLPHRGITIHQLSAYDVSRSMRGDPDALAVLRADLLRDAAAAG